MAIFTTKLSSLIGAAFAMTVLPVALAAKPAAAAPVTTDIVTNGSFENTQLNNGSWGIFQSIDGWNLLEGSQGSGIEVQNRAAGNPFDGNNLVELDSNGNTGIFQDLVTEIGKTYKLSFAFSARAGVAENILNVKWGGQSVANLSANGAGLGNTNWGTFMYDLVATSTTTRLSFDNFGSMSDSLGTYIDNVSVTTATAVPEPGSIVGIVAFGAFGVNSLRKRKQQKDTIQA
jgi:Protein of unknown function (DUF642)